MVGFVFEDGCTYAGRHLLIDFYDCAHIPDHHVIVPVMRESCVATGATVLFSHSHPFPGGGSSGVVILAESHGTWHSWTDERFVAVDIFVCGDCSPQAAVAVLEPLFAAQRVEIKLERRGIVSQPT